MYSPTQHPASINGGGQLSGARGRDRGARGVRHVHHAPLRLPPLVKSEPIPQLSSSQKSKPVARGAKRKALPAASTAQPAKRRKTASCLAGLKSMPFDDMG